MSKTIRLATDVEQLADQIKAAWGLDSTRDAIQAVMRTYGPQYLNGRVAPAIAIPSTETAISHFPTRPTNGSSKSACQAMSELDDLLNM